jgi:long-chain acyl-CoA synthetase
MERRSLVEYLDSFWQRGKECAYIQRRGYRTERWSYQQVAETAFQFARELARRGLGKGDRAILWASNSAEWVVAFLGAAVCGAIVVPVDNTATPDFTLRVAQQVSAKLWICSREHAPSSAPSFVLEDLKATVSPYSAASHPAEIIGPEDILEIVFTSGTTAEPKGVVITHGNVCANIAPLEAEIRNYLKYERLVHPTRFLSLLPLSHVFGQFLGIFLPQLMGSTVVFQEALKPGEIISTIRRERISLLVAVPRMLQSLKEKIERDLEASSKLNSFQKRFRESEGKHFLRRWWIFRSIHRQFGWKFWAFISGGAVLDRATEEFWGRLGFAVIQGYGLTETTSLISVNHPFRLGKGSIGKVLSGREVKLAEDGEILVRGAGVAAGYWSQQQLRPVSEDEGWYRTGDIGERDAKGNLYFKGRKKEVIVTSAGMNIYPEDLEMALRRQPEIKDCIVIGLPRDGNAEPCAVVILRGETDAEPIIRRANDSLAEFQRMRQWFVWPEQDFPRTSTQKPRGNLIREVVVAQLDRKQSRAGASPLSELIERVTGRPTENMNAQSHLETDLNLSSLDRMELFSALEDRYQVDLSETRFASVNTVGDLERMLHGEKPERVEYHYPAWVLHWPVTWIRLLAHYLLLRPSVLLLGWPRMEGREKLNSIDGPVLVICNHIGDVDVGFLHTALPGRLRHKLATATGGEALEILRTPPKTRNWIGRVYDRFKWILGVSLLNLFPLPREAGFRQSFAYAGECVDRGYSVLVFPEGHHTMDGKLHRFRAGIGLLANNLNVPIVPMRIDGLFELKQAGKKFAKPHQVTVKIGVPVRFPSNSDPEWIARQLETAVENL